LTSRGKSPTLKATGIHALITAKFKNKSAILPGMITQTKHMTYKKNDIVRIITNQPDVHLMEMFGHCDFKPEEITPKEYIARVKSVIADGKAYIVSVISYWGSVCILNPDEIIGQLKESELTEEQRMQYHERTHLDAPNVYDNDPSWLDKSLSVEEKCKAVARKAMAELFPEEKITEIEMYEGFFLRNYINDLNRCMEQAGNGKNKEELARLRTKRDKLESWFKKMRFKEYYAVKVGVTTPLKASETVTTFWLIAIDLNFEEVSIMRDSTERTHFYLSLGAEHDNLYHAKMDFARECGM